MSEAQQRTWLSPEYTAWREACKQLSDYEAELDAREMHLTTWS